MASLLKLSTDETARKLKKEIIETVSLETAFRGSSSVVQLSCYISSLVIFPCSCIAITVRNTTLLFSAFIFSYPIKIIFISNNKVKVNNN